MARKRKGKSGYKKRMERIPTTRYNPNPKSGLTAQQVQEHRLHGWTNRTVEAPSRTVQDIVHENVFTYFNLIFLVLSALLCVVGRFRSLTFLPVIIANALIGIIQEIRAKKVLDNLTMLHVPKATAVRDGKKVSLGAEELVLDDIVIFQAGEQICADAVVASGRVQVNEALLTGESCEITKKKGDTLMSGSFIVSGKCRARLTQVGEDSYISKLTLKAKEIQGGEQSEMIRDLDRLVKFAGFAIIPMGVALFIQAFFFQQETFPESIDSMVAAVIGMIPEGLYLLASVALVVSAMRLAKKKVLLHDMKCIETLARVDVLCVDKTGTITEDTMQVERVVATGNYKKKEMPPLRLLIGDFAAAMDRDNATMEAIQEYFPGEGKQKVVAKTGFSSATKYSSVTFAEKTFVLGAPEFVLKEDMKEYEGAIQKYASRGYRVVAFGTYDGEVDGSPLEKPIVPLGWILLANPIRKAAKETFSYFRKQGVAVKVISGDNPLTVSEVAKKAGIAHADKYVDASTLETEEEVRRAVLKYTVFGRVTPAQKRQFVGILQGAGKTVAMTGDGVNDVLALKDADCSIAMASGSEAAVQVSQIVLLESDFACMPQVVSEGRRVVNNIQRSASLFLVKNIFSFLLSLFSVAFMFTYPLKPPQISLISMFTIGLPAFFLAMEPNEKRIEGHFLSNVLRRALPAGLTDVFAIGALVVFAQTFGMNSTDIGTASTVLLAVVGFLFLYKLCVPLNKFRIAILLGAIVGFIFCSTVLSNLFVINGMSSQCIMLLVVFSIAAESFLRYTTILVGKLHGAYRKIKNKGVEIS